MKTSTLTAMSAQFIQGVLRSGLSVRRGIIRRASSYPLPLRMSPTLVQADHPHAPAVLGPGHAVHVGFDELNPPATAFAQVLIGPRIGDGIAGESRTFIFD